MQKIVIASRPTGICVRARASHTRNGYTFVPIAWACVYSYKHNPIYSWCARSAGGLQSNCVHLLIRYILFITVSTAVTILVCVFISVFHFTRAILTHSLGLILSLLNLVRFPASNTTALKQRAPRDKTEMIIR